MTEQGSQVIVIGAGASGLMAAGIAAGRQRQVLVLERNRAPGRKLLISGKGRCNVTNDTDIDGLMANIPGNPKFLRTAFYRFGPAATMAFFRAHGVPLKVERGHRVFPEDDDAGTVLRALAAFCRDNGARIWTEITVQEIEVTDGRVSGVRTADGRALAAGAVILAAGGASYPGTGSKGDGYRMAAALGHTVVPVRPALVPVETEETWPADAQGLSLRNVTLSTFAKDGKLLHRELGEMLLTHFGVSGPLVLTASRHVTPGCRFAIDLKPGLTPEELDARILDDLAKYRRREFRNALDDLLPQSLIPVIVTLSGIPPATYAHNVSRAQRGALGRLLKHLPLTAKRLRPFTEAIVTAGGVSVQEIDPRTMQSKRVPGLYFTGEVIDVDGYTGGFNLQIAWSTGFLAGENA